MYDQDRISIYPGEPPCRHGVAADDHCYICDDPADERCETCGNYRGECNPETHLAEMRAAEHAYYEGTDWPDRDDRDYDGPDDDPEPGDGDPLDLDSQPD